MKNVSKITRILREIDEGNDQATEQLLPIVYDELKAIARRKLAHERNCQTLSATALVHEAYLRLLGPADGSQSETQSWDSRSHFFSAAAESMRRILIDRARKKGRLKRGAGRRRVDLDVATIAGDKSASEADILDIDAALSQFAKEYPQQAELVTLRYFGGLTLTQIALVQGISLRSANRQWAFSKARLYELLRDLE